VEHLTCPGAVVTRCHSPPLDLPPNDVRRHPARQRVGRGSDLACSPTDRRAAGFVGERLQELRRGPLRLHQNRRQGVARGIMLRGPRAFDDRGRAKRITRARRDPRKGLGPSSASSASRPGRSDLGPLRYRSACRLAISSSAGLSPINIRSFA
jgi:hypothetical protein